MPHILTLYRQQVPQLPESGCWNPGHWYFFTPTHWQERKRVEHNEDYLQVVTYLLLHNAAGQVWCYQRAGGDERLDGGYSCGVGGHVDYADQETSFPRDPQMTLHRALLREVREELGASAADMGRLRFRGLIYEGLSAVGRVHLGVLYATEWLPPQPPQPVAGEKLLGLGFRDLQEIATDPRFELWSRLAAQYLIDATA